MIAVLTTILASLMIGTAGSRGRAQELSGRLDLHRLPVITGTMARMQWVRRTFGQAVEDELSKILGESMGYDLGSASVQDVDFMIPWLAARLKKKERLSAQAYLEVRDWTIATRPDLTRLNFSVAAKAARVWHRAIEREDPTVGGVVPKGKIVFEWPDGWTVQQLTTPKQIAAEGDSMQNCLKNLYQSISSDVQIYSVRKPSGRPVVDIEVRSGVVVQVRGRQNKLPRGAYADRAKEFIQGLVDSPKQLGPDARLMYASLKVRKQVEDLVDDLKRVQGRCQTRIIGEPDVALFVLEVEKARRWLKRWKVEEDLYGKMDAGGVGKSYGYAASTTSISYLTDAGYDLCRGSAPVGRQHGVFRVSAQVSKDHPVRTRKVRPKITKTSVVFIDQ